MPVTRGDDALGPVVLNVDDSDDRLRYRTLVLRDAGFEVLEARTGAQALDVATRALPALVLLDVHLPDLDGFEVCARLKAQSRTRAIPVLHVSAALRDEEHWVRGLRAGADGYLREPLGDEVLHEVIRTILRRAADEAAADRARRAAEEATSASEWRFRELVEHAPYGIGRTTTDGQLIAANQALADMLGFPSGDTLLAAGGFDRCFVDADERERLSAALDRGQRVRHLEATWRRRDDRPIRVSISGRRLPWGHELFVEDITERRSVETQLRQAQKLEALGLLTGGVAHDFNNALTIILGYTDLLTSQIGDDKPIGRDLAEIQRAAGHAAGLTRQLLAFSKEQPLKLEIVDLNQLAADSAGMLECLLGETIRLDSRLSAATCPINADAGQMQQILINLSVNARDAMPGGGALTIETARVTVDAAFAFRHAPLEPGRYVRLTVCDTGVGMDEETKDRIFDPFFTTKGVGRGTGLGLSTVYGITRQLHGVVLVDSRPNEGSRFDLYFPAADGAVACPAGRSPLEVAASAACVLVVEDDPGVRALTANTLSRHGYRVLQAADASGVDAMSEAALRAVDVLLTDMVMPMVSGRVLARHLRHRFPGIGVVYMSGYAGRPDGQGAPDDYPLLRKPFTAAELLAAIKPAVPLTPR
jgi:two-component system, cell cycle sensor histidine kinase and response regulator CckA